MQRQDENTGADGGGQTFLGLSPWRAVGACWALLFTLMGVTTFVASRGGSTGNHLSKGQEGVWLAATILTLIVSALGIFHGTQKRFGPWRFVGLGLSLLVLVLFFFEGVPEWRALGVWPFHPVEVGG